MRLERRAHPVGEDVGDHRAGIVSVAGISRSRVAETDHEPGLAVGHGGLLLRCLALGGTALAGLAVGDDVALAGRALGRGTFGLGLRLGLRSRAGGTRTE